MTGWFRTYRHPLGAAPEAPDFYVEDDRVYPVVRRGRRSERDIDPWFVIEGGLAYPTLHHPVVHSNEPWFEFVGSLLYPIKDNPGPGHPGPWYQQREERKPDW